MEHFAPRPSILMLAKAFIHQPCSEEELSKLWCKNDAKGIWFGRSAVILRVLSEWVWKHQKAKTPCIWIPDFFCDQSLSLLRAGNSRIVFYPIGENFEPKWDECAKLAETEPPHLFLLVHYFGNPNNAAKAKTFCRKYDSLFVEDCAHVLTPVGNIGQTGDFAFYSPHKHLPLPDGAILVVNLKSEKLEKVGFEKVIEEIYSLRKERGPGRPHTKKWVLKRLLQTCFGMLLQLLLKRNLPAFFPATSSSSYEGPILFSPMSRRLLSICKVDIPRIAESRKANTQLRNYLVHQEFPKVANLIQPSAEMIPYLAVYRGNENGPAESLYLDFQARQAAVQTWPDLPPEVLNNPSHPDANVLRRNLVYLGVHQDLSESHFLKTHSHFLPLIREKNVAGYELHVQNGKPPAKEFPDLSQLERPSLLQWPAYLLAKQRSNRWRHIQGLVEKDGKNVAFFSALVKNIGPFFSIYRINRGPVFLDSTAPEEQRIAVFKLLRKKFSLSKGKVLSLAPELETSPFHQLMLRSLGFRRLNHPSAGWHSGWISLQSDEGNLRKSLGRKWRNQLTSSEKTALKLHYSQENSIFEWLMTQYDLSMKEKAFEGPPVKFLTELHQSLNQSAGSCSLVFQAECEGTPVAGILVTGHGKAATYLVGWNSIEGRDCNANNFLLWNAMLTMKNLGYHWFDVGGLDDINTPHISNFKRGMGCVEYKLVGEYVSI